MKSTEVNWWRREKLVATAERDQIVPVSLASTGEAAANLSLDASTYKRVQHKNKFGKDYGREAY